VARQTKQRRQFPWIGLLDYGRAKIVNKTFLYRGADQLIEKLEAIYVATAALGCPSSKARYRDYDTAR
jgi:hypothetical protein